MNFYDGGLVETIPDDVEEGTLLIFPSVILHDSQPNLSDMPRTIVSFNIRGAR